MLLLLVAGSLGIFLLAGCAGGAGEHPRVARNRAGAAVDASGQPVRAPFYHEPMRVRNGCFVESVHVYDIYQSRHLGGEAGWVKVLQWGHFESDTRVGLGHAVAIFTWGGRLWTYDINHAFRQLAVPVERRADLTDVTPEIFAQYPAQRPVLPMYREDGFQQMRREVPSFLFYHADPEVRDATKVASELGRHRPVKVLAFNHTVDGVLKPGAAAVFLFGNRPCLYVPAKGTTIGRGRAATADDLMLFALMLRQVYPDASDIRWHEGGYWLFPPKAEDRG